MPPKKTLPKQTSAPNLHFSLQKIKKFQEQILTWYKTNKRDLPWRKTEDPYKILVSELMLQQTQVSRVIEKYNEFTTKFPIIQNLAEAPRAEVIKTWAGLGYNRRAIYLQECAKKIIADYGGIIPQDPDELIKLPGIGPYMCRSVLIFAFNQDYAAIDTNIRRILIAEKFAVEQTSQQHLQLIAEKVMPLGKSRDWHNALMDYGSLVLTSQGTGIKPTSTQSAFYKSFRWYRARVVKLLIQQERATTNQITQALKKDEKFVKEVLISLEKDNLIEQIKKGSDMYSLPSS